MPIRFGLSYSDPNGPTGQEDVMADEQFEDGFKWQYKHLKKGTSRPIIVHRAIFGSIERFTAMLLEHTGGKLPFFLAPRQFRLLPITKDQIPYAKEVCDQLKSYGFEVDIDTEGQIGKRVRIGWLDGVCY